MKREKIQEFPYFKLFIAYFFILTLISINIWINSGIIIAIDFFTKSLFFPLSFYLFYAYFEKHDDLKVLIAALILSGLFPLFISLFQKATGYVWRYQATRGLIRSGGLYHDVVTPRIYFIQALVAIFIYWRYFIKPGRKIFKITVFTLSIFFFIGLYFLYSKTVVVTMISWILVFSLLRKKIYFVPISIILILLINYFTDNRISKEIHQLFSREVSFLEGNLQADYVLSGRGGIWMMYYSTWPALSMMSKIIGIGRSHGYFHNDFIRILFGGGILLLSFYIILTLTLIMRTFCEYHRKGTFINFAALLCILYFFMESLGQLPGLYPNLQMLTWGLVGLSLNQKVQWIEDHESKR